MFTIFIQTFKGPVEVNLPIDSSLLSAIAIIKKTVSGALLVQPDGVQIMFLGKLIDDFAETESVSPYGVCYLLCSSRAPWAFVKHDKDAKNEQQCRNEKRPREEYICPGCGCEYNGNSQYCSRRCLMSNG